ncbi:MAG TPA: vanadium-dependent haloperoxidase [Thermoanaerobaculia bacterium]|nr:vanadium-dependent haloperoxidase [Thermoanaerobaculia bacterium]
MFSTATFRKLSVAGFGVCVALAGTLGEARADVVTDWNGILLDAVRAEKSVPPHASRAMACVNVSIFEAVNGILGLYEPYSLTDPAPPGASPEAAAAAAAYQSLSQLFPAQRKVFDAALKASLSAIPEGPSKEAGIAWGLKVADAIIALRADDGATREVNPRYPSGAGWWTPTPPDFASGLLPNWAGVKPWAMANGSQFRPPPPPALGSADYLKAFSEVARLGRIDSPSRSKEQSQIALFWADGSGTSTPPGHWLLVALRLASQRNLTLHESSRLFALLSMAMADAAIVSWDSKYHYDHWRPVTGIRHAELEGNGGTRASPPWVPFIATPPFPSYTSGHSTFSGSASRILELFFGTDAVLFSLVSEGLPGVERFFASFSQAAEEAGQSRIYGGIHWQYDNQAGLASGRALGDHVFHSRLRPRSPTAPGRRP